MPIKFRCQHCHQFLGISPSKAGELTDCPTCGRTIRIPNLDGTVDPLPQARLDLRDAELAEALTALSRIGTAPDAQSRAADRSNGSVVTRPVAEQASNGPPAPAAERVFFDPPLPAEPIGPDRRTAGSAPPVIALPDASVLPEDGPLSRRFWGNRKNRHAAGPIVAVSALAIGMFAAGFLAGWWAARRATTDAGVQPSSSRSQFEGSAPRAAASSPHPTDAPAVAGVGGTVEYVLPDGRTRPDRGARVLALPAERPPTSVLAVAGFRAGAVPTERERATAAIRAVGGDFALTDAEGRYVLQLPPGAYDVLFLSRHVSRDAAQPDDESLTELLAAYFDQPAALVGSVHTDRVSLKHSGGTVRLDHRFER